MANKRISGAYRTWESMRRRCLSKGATQYAYYGGRGISICKSWDSFDNFLLDMGERPEGMTLDRIDSNGNYEPANCRWATRLEQGQNKRSSIMIDYGAERICLSEYARRTGQRYENLLHAANRGRLLGGVHLHPKRKRELTFVEFMRSVQFYNGTSLFTHNTQEKYFNFE